MITKKISRREKDPAADTTFYEWEFLLNMNQLTLVNFLS
jgi:hypothetical protein